ncbi:MAG: phage major capsid protein, partial [Kofleriaceae bacterium]
MARLIHAAAARQLGERFEDDGFEREVSREIEKHLPDTYRSQGGFFVPTNLRNLPQFASRAGLDSGTATKGAELKFTEQGEFIDMLRARMKVRQLGARTLSGLVGPVLFPKQTAAGTFTMVGENPGADVAESNLLLGTVALNPKTGQSTTSFSKQLLAQVRTPDVEGLVREDLAKEHALGIEGQAISGSGAGNNCTGLTATAGIGSVAGGANGAAPTWDNIVDLETAIAAANADVATMGYLTTPGIRGKLKKT